MDINGIIHSISGVVITLIAPIELVCPMPELQGTAYRKTADESAKISSFLSVGWENMADTQRKTHVALEPHVHELYLLDFISIVIFRLTHTEVKLGHAPSSLNKG